MTASGPSFFPFSLFLSSFLRYGSREIPNQANGRAARFERVRTQLEAEGWRGQYLEKLINVIKRTVQNKDDEAMFHMHSYLRGRGFCVENTKERDLELALFCRGVDLPYSDF